jgi:Domain of unknown function (DUF4902)
VIQSSKNYAEVRGAYSGDGYVRLTFPQLCRLKFDKRQMFTDEELLQELLDQNIPALDAGYCDWLDVSTSVQISVGWAWFTIRKNPSRVLAPGGVSSNVMLTSADGSDLGTNRTDELLQAWLSARAWESDGRSPNIKPGRERSIH